MPQDSRRVSVLLGVLFGLAGIDLELAHELWASVEGIVELAKLPDLALVQVDYDEDPFGVQYWVLRWASQIP